MVKIVPLFTSPAYPLQRCGLCCNFLLLLLVLIMWFGFTNHAAGLSKAIDCNKYLEPVCVSVIVQLSFSWAAIDFSFWGGGVGGGVGRGVI